MNYRQLKIEQEKPRKCRSTTALDAYTKKLFASLKKTATEILEEKRRLGQYAVIWQNGAPLIIDADPPSNEHQTPPEDQPNEHSSKN